MTQVRPLSPQAAARSIAACPSCGGASLEPIYQVSSIPLHSCVLLDTPETARAFPQRDLELAFCHSCGFVFNAIFDETAMRYSVDFEESQHFSETFNAFARGLAEEVARICGVTGKRVVEIGCGKGEFLAELCRIATASGIGIDPAYRADPGRTDARLDLQFLPESFGSQHLDLPADVVVCRHTLEHIPQVGRFVAMIREMIGARSDVRVMFETPDAARVFRDAAFWDIYYEHCSYLSLRTHADLFAREGFVVDETRLVYDGQYIIQYARPAAPGASAAEPDPSAVDEMRRLTRGFAARARRAQEEWFERVQRSHRQDGPVVVWGGGSKAVSFLTTLGLGAEVQAAVDVNPYKQGKFTPGSAHPVVAPDALKDIGPGTVIVMNPIYVPEIRAALDALGLAPVVLSL